MFFCSSEIGIKIALRRVLDLGNSVSSALCEGYRGNFKLELEEAEEADP
jgi:hypothetical protein